MRKKTLVIATPRKSELATIAKSYAEAESKLKKIEAEVELKIQKIRDQKAPEVMELQKEMVEASEKLKAYAMDHKENEFTKKRSKDLVHAIIGFRLGTPKAKTEKGYTWKVVLDLIQKAKLSFTKVKVDIDKEKIIASREDEDTMKALKECGVYVDQDETFFVETKEEVLA